MKKAVIFDLDGTLLNTLDDLTNSVNFAMRQLQLAQHTCSQVRSMVGNGVAVLMQRAVGQNQHLWQQALQLQRSYYATHFDDNTLPYCGVVEMLRKLNEQHVVLVHTNKDKDIAVQLCQRHFGQLVQHVCGTEADGITKPNPTKILQLLRTIEVQSAVYCGDSRVDLQTAANVGIPCISVTWGFGDRQQLQQAGAANFAESADDVVRLAQQILK